MTESERPDAPISVRLPKCEVPKRDAKGIEKHLDERGFAVLDRDSLYKLFQHAPDSVRRIAPLLEPDTETEEGGD